MASQRGLPGAHQRLYSARLELDKYRESSDQKVELEVQKEREKSESQSRTIWVSGLQETTTAQKLASFFASYGNPMRISLLASRSQAGSGRDRLHDGCARVEFADNESIKQLEQACSKAHDGHGKQQDYLLESPLGRKGTIRFHRWTAQKSSGEILPGSEALLFRGKEMQLGHLSGSKYTMFVASISGEIEFVIHTGGFAWELQLADNRYRFTLAFKHVAGKAAIQELEDGQAALLIPVRQPPKIFRLLLKRGEIPALNGGEEEEANHLTNWQMPKECWRRTTDFTQDGWIGTCFLYRFPMLYTMEELSDRQKSIIAPLLKIGVLQQARLPLSNTKQIVDPKTQLVELEQVSFKVRYHLECLTSVGLINPSELSPLLATLHDQRLQEEVVVHSLTMLMVAKRRISNPTRDFRNQVIDTLHDQRTMQDLASPLPAHCMMVARVLVTPTRIVRFPPEVELSNRVLRQYKQYSDRFLRISFGDEDGTMLHVGNGRSMNVDLVRRMEETMSKGIRVAGRHFEFLAFSSSQLKEHSIWAFAATPGLNAADIRTWMGDFADIRNVAKYAARMGQCFSSTLDTIELQESEVLQIPDIQHDGYVFSDGCGLMSAELGKSINSELTRQGRFGRHVENSPCAYQLRYGGSKGVIVLYPHHPEYALSGRRMLLRPSMQKFEAQSRRIEIVGFARFLPAFLNRQIICILYQKSLGIPDSAFADLQDSMLGTLNRMLHDSSAALDALGDYAKGENEELVHSLQCQIEAGFDVQQEPYLRGLLGAMRLHLLKDLKNKTRIYVPEAALLMGVVDELGILEYGQVFVQIDRSALLNSPQLVTGPIIVAKNPCFHPGDIRVLQAVPAPSLSHLRNIIVFPQKGKRPHSNEISGSDLDGDNYFCSWRADLIPPQKHVQPMEFPADLPKELERAVDIDDVAAFFVDHAVLDNLGVIANSHLALADISPRGVFDARCLLLAELHSKAVDFPKTGITVEIPWELRPVKYPDFMQKTDRESYTSETIIGRLFRQVQEPLHDDKQILNRKLDKDLVVEGFSQHLKEAQRLKHMYEQQLLSIMNQFNIFDEFQLLTGYVSAWDTMHSRRNGQRYNARTHVIEAMKALRAKFFRIFEKSNRQPGSAAEAQSRASAWYVATYSPDFKQDGLPVLYSFAWIADKYLIEIKQQRARSKPSRSI